MPASVRLIIASAVPYDGRRGFTASAPEIPGMSTKNAGPKPRELVWPSYRGKTASGFCHDCNASGLRVGLMMISIKGRRDLSQHDDTA